MEFFQVDKNLNYGREQIRLLCEQVRSYQSVLDLGAGYGNDLKSAMSVCPQAEYHGVECSPELQQKLKADGIQTVSLNIENQVLPFQNKHFDLVMTNQFLEHTKEIFWINHEVARVLKVGGYFLVGVPNLASFHSRLLLALGRQPTCIQTASAHVRGFTKFDFLRFLEKCFPGGYQLEGFAGSNFYPFPPVIAKPLAAVFPNMAVSIFMLLKKTKEYNGEFLQYPVAERLETNFFLGH